MTIYWWGDSDISFEIDNAHQALVYSNLFWAVKTVWLWENIYVSSGDALLIHFKRKWRKIKSLVIIWKKKIFQSSGENKVWLLKIFNLLKNVENVSLMECQNCLTKDESCVYDYAICDNHTFEAFSM